jgi:hypothetical protein
LPPISASRTTSFALVRVAVPVGDLGDRLVEVAVAHDLFAVVAAVAQVQESGAGRQRRVYERDEGRCEAVGRADAVGEQSPSAMYNGAVGEGGGVGLGVLRAGGAVTCGPRVGALVVGCRLRPLPELAIAWRRALAWNLRNRRHRQTQEGQREKDQDKAHHVNDTCSKGGKFRRMPCHVRAEL